MSRYTLQLLSTMGDLALIRKLQIMTDWINIPIHFALDIPLFLQQLLPVGTGTQQLHGITATAHLRKTAEYIIATFDLNPSYFSMDQRQERPNRTHFKI